VSRGGEDEVDGVAVGSEQEVASDKSVGLGVADDRPDGAAASQFAPGSAYAPNGGDAALLSGAEDAIPVGVVPR
jgi:hypothetical protein